MSEIYWITRLGTINEILVVLCIVSLVAILVFCIGYFIAKEDIDEHDDIILICKKWIRISFITLIVAGILCLFIPSKKELLLIYGLGTTIDYIQGNDKAKQLPDKAIEALTKYMDEDDESEKE